MIWRDKSGISRFPTGATEPAEVFMNFDFSHDQKVLRDQARKFLAEHASSARVRRIQCSGRLTGERLSGLRFVGVLIEWACLVGAHLTLD